MAIHRFRGWQARDANSTVGIPNLNEPGPYDYVPETGWEPPKTEVAAAAYWAHLRDLILNQASVVAEMTGIPEMAHFADLPRRAPSPTLKEVGELYFAKASITPHELSKSKLFWTEFCDSVEVPTVRELTAQLAAVYLDDVLAADNSPTYAKHRFGKVKTILNFGRTRGLSPADIRTGLDACAVLVPPKSITMDPHPIAREHFAALLKAADAQEQAMLLFAMNACMYGKEISDIRWEDLNLDKGVLIADRGKTKVTRVATLWPRTVAALRALPRRISSPFVTARGAPHNGSTANKMFSNLRRRAGLSDDVKFSDVRDGAYTSAVGAEGVQFETCRILAGHRVGMSDHYIKRNPRLVAAACEAVEKAYFA